MRPYSHLQPTPGGREWRGNHGISLVESIRVPIFRLKIATSFSTPRKNVTNKLPNDMFLNVSI